MTWTNPSAEPVDSLMLHLYMNAFRSPDTEFMRNRSGWNPDDAGWIDILRLQLRYLGDENYIELSEEHYAINETVMTVPLPNGFVLSTGRSLELRMEFRVKLPRIFARTGYSGDYYMLAQWFPKMGVFADGRWICPQYYPHSEFFADFGEYRVRITAPKNYRIGATGILDSVVTHDGTKTYLFKTEQSEDGELLPVHDFAWAASPDFRLVEREIAYNADGRERVVLLNLLVQRDRQDIAGRYVEAVSECLQVFGEHYGPYPYSKLTVIDPGPGRGQRSGGMEYPMLITGGSSWVETFLFPGDKPIEGITAHEFGHQYWYGVVANDEFNEPWIDEGLTTYSTDKVIDTFGPAAAGCRFPKLYSETLLRLHPFNWGLSFDFARLSPLLLDRLPSTTLTERRNRYLLQPGADPITNEAYRTLGSLAYGVGAYDKPALALRSLEYLIGEETVRTVLRRFYTRFRFRHPTGSDFRELVGEAAGEDMEWFFSQVWDGTGILDYAVTGVTSRRDDEGGFYVSEVTAQRLGEVVVPQILRIAFAGGGVIDLSHWNRKSRATERLWMEEFVSAPEVDGLNYRIREGREGRWLRVSLESEEPVASAQVDPEYGYLLDLNFANNSRRADADSGFADLGSLEWARLLSRWLHHFSVYN